MSHSLLDVMKMIHYQMDQSNLDIHTMTKEIKKMLDLSHQNAKLRIINQFILLLYVLVLNNKYGNIQETEKVKSLVKEAFLLIEGMSDGTIIYTHAAKSIMDISTSIRQILIEKIESSPFLYDVTLIGYSSEYLDRDLKDLEFLYQNISLEKEEIQYKMIIQTILRMYNLFLFLGIESLSNLVDMIHNFVIQQHRSGFLFQLNSNLAFLSAMDYLFRQVAFLKLHANDRDALIKNFSNSNVGRYIDALRSHGLPLQKIPDQEMPAMLLTEEEVDALMDDKEFDTVSFDNSDDSDMAEVFHNSFSEASKSHISTLFTATQYSVDEDRIIKLLGRLFQKQEELTENLSPEAQIMLKDDIQELSILTENLKELIFRKYYATIKDLFGQDLRSFIQEETKLLEKNVYLDIRGESSEILLRESQFVKEIVFALVKNSLHYSIETPPRRKALEKSKSGWLSIEFDDSGDKLDIFVRDDGYGLDMTHMGLSGIEQKIKNRGGTIQIDTVDREYLKVKVELPMRKVISDCLVISLGDTKVLIPNRCVQKVLSINEVAVMSIDDSYLGKVNLALLLGIGKLPVNIFVLCHFGDHKICFGVQDVLYTIDALVEAVNTRLIPCAKGVSILKDGFLGFVLNERLLFESSVEMIKKRAQMVSVEKN